jgi:hypothetical protein
MAQSDKYKLLLLLFVFIWSRNGLSQPHKQSNGTFYLGFGPNFSYFSQSDIHLKRSTSPEFDFALYNVRGKDDGGINFRNGAPQYSYAVGFYDKRKKWGIELSFDHIKYYILQNQRVHMEGSINNEHFDVDTLLVPSFVKLEHTDGANYLLLKLVKRIRLNMAAKNDGKLNAVFKAAIGPVIPKTNSTIMGNHRDDRYNVAGYVFALESGVRYSFARFLFIEGGAKGAYANYKHFLIAGGTGSQQWLGLHLHLLLGVEI